MDGGECCRHPPSVQFEGWKINRKGGSTALLPVIHTTGTNMEFNSTFTLDGEECCRPPHSVQFEGCKINRGGSTTFFASDTHNLEKHKEGIQVLSMCMIAFQAIMWDQQT